MKTVTEKTPDMDLILHIHMHERVHLYMPIYHTHKKEREPWGMISCPCL